MIFAWILYTLLLGTLLAAAARCLEEGARAVGLPLRWIWLGALTAFVVLVALAPLRSLPAAGAVVIPAVTVQAAADPGAAAAAHGRSSASLLQRVREAVVSPVEEGLTSLAAAGPVTGRTAALLWGASSLLVLLALLATTLRYARLRRRWSPAEIAEARVLVSPGTGPAVVGLLRPEIVVPRWLTASSDEEQEIVVLHEKEHVRAHDPAVLALGCLMVTLIPWHPAAWWMLIRLRMAVELDCDRRVLASGVRPLAYGSVLIDMAGRGSGIYLGAPALADTPSTLERRISAMTSRFSPFASARAAALTLPAAALLFVACDAELPTATEVEAMDVATVEEQAQRFQMISRDGSVSYFLNGEEVDAEEARAVLGDRIDRVEVLRPGEEGVAEIRIRTREHGAEGDPELRIRGERGDGEERRIRILRHDAESGDAVRVLGRDGEERQLRIVRPGEGAAIIAHRDGEGDLSADRFDGIIEIDGERADQAAFRSLRPGQIESVEVLKGDAAASLYHDPAARNGVIRIRTRERAPD